MVVRLYPDIGGHLAIRDNQIQTMYRQIGQQCHQAAFAADDPHRLCQLQHRLHQSQLLLLQKSKADQTAL